MRGKCCGLQGACKQCRSSREFVQECDAAALLLVSLASFWRQRAAELPSFDDGLKMIHVDTARQISNLARMRNTEVAPDAHVRCVCAASSETARD